MNGGDTLASNFQERIRKPATIRIAAVIVVVLLLVGVLAVFLLPGEKKKDGSD